MKTKREKIEKEFDAVQLQRDIRNKLAKEFEKKPELRNKRLTAIRKKYGLVAKQSQFANQ